MSETNRRANKHYSKMTHERNNFDLQTFTLQKPRGLHRVLPTEMTKIGAYPVAVLPGQYTDFYR
ncbi:hypothetical protein SK128_006811, partial [Halocaridina rubra]